MDNFKFPRYVRPADMPKHWNESHDADYRRHAPASFRRDRVRSVRTKENHHLRTAITNDTLETYEPLYLAKRDADWLYF